MCRYLCNCESHTGSQCDDHFDTLLMVGGMATFGHMVTVMVSVMITSNSDDSQYDNGQSSHVTVYAATGWQCICMRRDSVTASVYTAAK